MNQKFNMKLFTFLIYNKNGLLLFTHEFTPGQPCQNLFGTIYASRNLVLQFDKSPDSQFLNFSTNKYSCHMYESITGLLFVVLTENTLHSFSSNLHQFYQTVYQNYVVADPGYNLKAPTFSDEFFNQLVSWAQQLK